MPKVSLVIPIHGEAEFLEQTLDSLAEAVSPPNEVVLVLDRIKADPWLKIENWLLDLHNWTVATSLEPGLASALNVGINASMGEFLARLDSDDLLIPDRLMKQSNFLEKHPDHVAVGGQLKRIGEVQSDRQITYLPIFDWQIRSELGFFNPLAHPAMMYRIDSLIQVGGYKKEIRFGQDYDLAHRLLKIGKIRNLPNIVTDYRIHDNQISTSNWLDRLPQVAAVMFEVNDRKISLAECDRIAFALANPNSTWLKKFAALMTYGRRLPVRALRLIISKCFTLLFFSASSWKLS